MISEPFTAKFTQFTTSANHIYALDDNGKLWFRILVPYSYAPNAQTRKDDERKEEEAVWKPVNMRKKVDIPIPTEEKEIQEKESKIPQDGFDMMAHIYS